MPSEERVMRAREVLAAIDDLDLLTDALLAGKTLSTEECRRAKAAVLTLKAPDIDRSGLAQEVEESHAGRNTKPGEPIS